MNIPECREALKKVMINLKKEKTDRKKRVIKNIEQILKNPSNYSVRTDAYLQDYPDICKELIDKGYYLIHGQLFGTLIVLKKEVYEDYLPWSVKFISKLRKNEIPKEYIENYFG